MTLSVTSLSVGARVCGRCASAISKSATTDDCDVLSPVVVIVAGLGRGRRAPVSCNSTDRWARLCGGTGRATWEVIKGRTMWRDYASSPASAAGVPRHCTMSTSFRRCLVMRRYLACSTSIRPLSMFRILLLLRHNWRNPSEKYPLNFDSLTFIAWLINRTTWTKSKRTRSPIKFCMHLNPPYNALSDLFRRGAFFRPFPSFPFPSLLCLFLCLFPALKWP